MPRLIGTSDGLYRVDDGRFRPDDLEPVLDCGSVRSLRSGRSSDEIYAGTDAGVYRSVDGGRSWTDRSPPTDRPIWSILATAAGALFAGTDDPFLFRSLDGGESWTERSGFRALPSRGTWASPGDPDRARLRSLDTPPDRPEVLVAGIEVGGVHASHDGGATWEDGLAASQDDIHQVQALSEEVFIAATGYFDLTLEGLDQGHALATGGLYRTADGGTSWERLDRGHEHAYVRAFYCANGLLCMSGARGPPPAWREDGVDAALYESTDLGRTFERVSDPGGGKEIVEAWADDDGTPLGGTARYGRSGDGRPRGRVIRQADRGYRTVGLVPEPVKALLSLSPSDQP